MRTFACLISFSAFALTVSGQFGPEQVITFVANESTGVYAADLDGDGDRDVLWASAADDKVAWQENLGGDSWGTERVITISADSVLSIYALDLDGDGDVDVLSASANDDKIAWYENLGGGDFGYDPQIPGWNQKIITTSADGANTVYALDLDGDGDADVLSASEYDHKIAWYENLGGGDFGDISGPNQRVISNMAFQANGLYVSDIDGDGDPDVLSSSWGHNLPTLIAWYENQGAGEFGNPALNQQVIIENGGPGSGEHFRRVFAGDLDGDGDVDVLSGDNDGAVLWSENGGTGSFTGDLPITSTAPQVTGLSAVDIDRDGDVDVLSSSKADNKIAWYENLNDGFFGPSQVITTSAGQVSWISTADLDGDGDTDVLSASMDGKIAWYENIFPTPPFISLGGALAGQLGEPLLQGAGMLQADTLVTLTLNNAAPHMLSCLFIGVSEANDSFKGGVMVPSPDAWIPNVTGAGVSVVDGRWPIGIPAGEAIYLQWWIVDSAGVQGFAASNAMQLTAP